jgi:hypothetical protein
VGGDAIVAQLQEQLTPALQIMVCDAAPHLEYNIGWHRQHSLIDTRGSVCHLYCYRQ